MTYDSGLTSSGFHGTALTTGGANPQIIIGFEGTDTSGYAQRPQFLFEQIEADLSLYRGVVPQALRDAQQFTQHVLAAAQADGIPLSQITISGHSLGAAEAAYVSALDGLGGITFAAPGLPQGSVPPASPANLTNYVEYGDPVANYSATPENYEGAFLFNPGISRVGSPTFIGDSFARYALELTGYAYGSHDPDTRDAALTAFAGLADLYHPLTTYGTDLNLNTNSPPGPPSSLSAGQLALLYGDIADRHPLVNDAYYEITNPDVFAAGVDAEVHYDSYGWKEGRNPNPYFSTTGYEAANIDVARAGVNPLDHYDTNGWREGRDPSAGFDTELYLKHNPDVAAAGIDPLTHYLEYGKAEGRQAYAAIGQATSFTHGPFDAEYYLLANPDVAKAALAAGSDTFAFAYQHYETNGWHEGRMADAYFDPAFYLAHNPDVAAAGIDPLTHYDQFGWKEGRDPSGAFHTAAYLAENPDVAAAHIDPLTHYLQFGADEGRHLV